MPDKKAKPVEPEETRGDMEVLGWRYKQLSSAGYPTQVAIILAEADRVDLHLACELLARGCSVKTALKILV